MKSYREVQPHILRAFCGSKVDGISFSQVHPFDFYAARENHVGGTVPSSATQEGAARFRRKMAFTAEEMHHHFVIESLGKPGSFRSQPYLYTCVRCKWMFRINDPRGSIIALDGLGRHLPEPENTKRALTFHLGPCSAFHFQISSIWSLSPSAASRWFRFSVFYRGSSALLGFPVAEGGEISVIRRLPLHS
jgi:hypothetical protein